MGLPTILRIVAHFRDGLFEVLRHYTSKHVGKYKVDTVPEEVFSNPAVKFQSCFLGTFRPMNESFANKILFNDAPNTRF